jgi:4-amino-4-deoxy-L-arabinose transferase-like glycosyltransferase
VKAALVLLAAAAAVRLLVAAFVPLVPDEAYYWEWSRHLAAGYFDHPPVIAWLIRAGTLIGGATPFGVRAGPIVAGWVGTCAAASLASRLGGPQAAWRLAVLLTVVPLAGVGLILATPDAPLLTGSAVMLWAIDHALSGGG